MKMLTQGDETGDLSLFDITKDWLKAKYRKPGNVFLGLVHRLDRTVSGILLFAKTSKAAGRVSEQFRSHQVEKTYRALVQGIPVKKSQELRHYLTWEGERAKASLTPQPGAKEAHLHYRLVKTLKDHSLLEIIPRTGRKHQIRVQLAYAGHPILGDKRYGATSDFAPGAIGLLALRLKLEHPVRKEPLIFEVPHPFSIPWE